MVIPRDKNGTGRWKIGGNCGGKIGRKRGAKCQLQTRSGEITPRYPPLFAVPPLQHQFFQRAGKLPDHTDFPPVNYQNSHNHLIINKKHFLPKKATILHKMASTRLGYEKMWIRVEKEPKFRPQAYRFFFVVTPKKNGVVENRRKMSAGTRSK